MAITIRDIFDDSSRHHSEHTVNFEDESIITTVTSTPSVVRRWLGFTIHTAPFWARRNLVVGIGVQWVPKPYSSSPDPEPSTLQLCVGRRCLIFQLIHSPTVPRILRRFLLHPNNTFVGMWNYRDRDFLNRSRHELILLKEPLDLREHVKSPETGASFKSSRREEIIKECLGYSVRFSEAVGMSDWDEDYLSHEQIAYAVVDARASFLIGKKWKAWNFDRDNEYRL